MDEGRARHPVRARPRQALLNAFHVFPFALANAIMHEPERRGAPATRHVKALGARHGAALARTLKRWRIPHELGASPLVTVPFLLAGYYLARMLEQLARAHTPTPAFFRIRDEGQEELDTQWGSGARGVELFTNPKDRAAWWGNCALAGLLLEKLEHVSPESLVLVRRCQNPACPGPFYVLGMGPRERKTCGRSRCRVALFRASASIRPRRDVTSLPAKRKVLGLSAPAATRRSPLVSRLSAR